MEPGTTRLRPLPAHASVLPLEKLKKLRRHVSGTRANPLLERLRRLPTAGRARPCGLVAAACGLAWFRLRRRGRRGVTRHKRAVRAGQGGSALSPARRALRSGRGWRMAVGSSMLATIRSVPPQWLQVLTSMLTKSPGAIWNSRKAGPKGGGQDARSNTRLRRCALGHRAALVAGAAVVAVGPSRLLVQWAARWSVVSTRSSSTSGNQMQFNEIVVIHLRFGVVETRTM